MQNEWAGAQAFSSFDTYMAPFVRRDGLSYEQVRQGIQELVYNLNVPSRWGTQTPFTNLTFDWTCPDDLRDEVPFVAGEPCDFTYGDLQAEMDLINRAYIEVMTDGDASGRVFTFPIPTYNITHDFDWHSENADRLFAMTARYGLPYFQNFLNSEMNPGDVRSMCCRLQLDLRELLKRGNGLFGSAEQTGLARRRHGQLRAGSGTCTPATRPACSTRSTGCSTWRGRRSSSSATVIAAVPRRRAVPVHPALPRARSTTTSRRSASTASTRWCATSPATPGPDRPGGARAASVRLLDHVRARMVEFQEATGHLYNLEATPAEGTTYRFAKEDRAPVPGHPAGRHGPTTRTTPTPRSCRWASPTTRSRPSSGRTSCRPSTPAARCCTCTCRSGSRRPRPARELVRRALDDSACPYITVTPTFSICASHGYLAGEHRTVPDVRGDECEVWTRVMGYHRPVSARSTSASRASTRSACTSVSPSRSPPAAPRVTPRPLVVAGLTPLSSCDWPGQLVATAFLQGCPWRCTYCHNAAILDPRAPGTVPWRDVLDLLARRHGLLDGLVFSGGEPTRQARPVPTAARGACAGFGVGLHTVGHVPEPPAGAARPGRLGGVRRQGAGAALPCGHARRRPDDERRRDVRVAAPGAATPASTCEVRTTVDPTVHGPDDVAELTDVLAALGVRRARAAAGQAGRDDGRVPGGAGRLLTRPHPGARAGCGRRPAGEIMADADDDTGLRGAG